jgi:hypothetical protein
MTDFSKERGEALAPPSLTHIANRFLTDKGSTFGNAHNYTQFYTFLLESWRHQKFNMLELGLQGGGGDPLVYLNPDRPITDVPSIRMWLEYFPQAHCFGFDYSDFSSIRLPRFTFVRGNLSNDQDLRALANALPPVRLVIDDASHASYHQQRSFASLFEHVESNGFYIIEDLDYQPPYEHQMPPCLKTRDVFSRFVETGQLILPGVNEEGSEKLASSVRNVFVLRHASNDASAGMIRLLAIQKG